MYKCVIITTEQAAKLKNQTFNGVFFNPIQDLNNNWIVSEDEIKQSNIIWLKQLPLINYQSKITNSIL